MKAQNGKFSIKGSNAKDAFLGLQTDNSLQILFINDGTPITADCGSRTIKGSELNNKLNEYDRQLYALIEELSACFKPYKEARDSGKSEEELNAITEELSKKVPPIQKKIPELKMSIIRENLDNIIPAAFINDVMYNYELDELKELLSPKHVFSKHPMAATAKKYLDDMIKKMSVIGTQFKDLEMNDTNGKAHKLSEYCGKGNYVFVDFWASWCGPCRGEIPNVKANYDKYHSKGFEIVGLSFDNNEEAWKKAIEEMELKWINLSDLMGWKSIAASIYGIKSIPSSLLIDPEGKIVAIDLRAYLLGDKLKEIYGF